LTRPVNYVVGVGGPRLSVSELADIGVRRVSLGTSLIRSALSNALAAAREILEHGTFGYADGVPTVAQFNALISPRR
jgi:2-methylisocitrate lyase-like PEP mutase family enzyme